MVLMPLPVPRLVPLAMARSMPHDAGLLPRILKSMAPSDGDDLPEATTPEAQVHRLSGSQLLIQRLWAHGAYQSAYGFWIAHWRARMS